MLYLATSVVGATIISGACTFMSEYIDMAGMQAIFICMGVLRHAPSGNFEN